MKMRCGVSARVLWERDRGEDGEAWRGDRGGGQEGKLEKRFFSVLTLVRLLVDNDLLLLRSDAIKKLVRWGCDEHWNQHENKSRPQCQLMDVISKKIHQFAEK